MELPASAAQLVASFPEAEGEDAGGWLTTGNVGGGGGL